PKHKLADLVVEVVSAESPVHIDEVITRLREAWGLKRAGTQIRGAVQRAVLYAKAMEDIVKKDEFLFRPEHDHIIPRKRMGETSPNIDLISEEEISIALQMII